jgi:hypothetical protein
MTMTQQFAIGLVAVLMLGTTVLSSTQSHSQTTRSAAPPQPAASIVASSQVSAELPQDQVRDLTY